MGRLHKFTSVTWHVSEGGQHSNPGVSDSKVYIVEYHIILPSSLSFRTFFYAHCHLCPL